MQIGFVRHVHPPVTRRAGSAAPSPADQPSATDAVELSGGTSRVLFSEAARLNLLPSSAAVPGPLGAVLSQAAQDDLKALFGQFEAAGLEFHKCVTPRHYRTFQDKHALSPDELTERVLSSAAGTQDQGRFGYLVVHGPGMEAARVDDLADLQSLQAFVLDKDTSQLAQPRLADQLLKLEERGFQPLLTEREVDESGSVTGGAYRAAVSIRKVGAYGAYRALTGAGEENLLWTRKGQSDAHRLQTAADVGPLAYFELDQPGWEPDELATSIKGLADQGYSFTNGNDQVDPLAAHNRYSSWSSTELAVGVLGNGGRRSTREQVLNPELLDPAVLALGEFFNEKIRGQGSPQEEELTVRILAFEPPGGTLTERHQALMDLRQLEADHEPQLESIQKLGRAGWNIRELLKLRNPDEPLSELVDAYRQVRADLPHGVAVKALAFFRQDLPGRSVDAEDYATQRSELTELARGTTSFEQIPLAHELIRPDLMPESFAERVDVFHTMVEAYRELPMEEVGTFDRRQPEQEAVDDYRFLLAGRRPGQGLAEASNGLVQTHQQLAARIGFKGSREVFGRFQKLGLDSLAGYLAGIGQVLDQLEQARGADKPGKELTQDYNTVLRHRQVGQDLDQAGSALARLHREVGSRVGWEQSRVGYGQLQSRFERGQFGGASFEQAVEQYVGEQKNVLDRLDGAYDGKNPELAEDYQAMLTERPAGHSAEEGAELLGALALALRGKARPEESRKLYIRMVQEHQKGVFGERSPRQVVSDFLQAMTLTDDRAKAYTVARFGSPAGQDISFDDDQVIIGDFHLPIESL
ncbi:MAG: hypothetical protein AB7S38_41525 [Vulcanimicrobiota bacterium]